MEISVEQLLLLSAEALHVVLETIDYGNMTQKEIIDAIKSKIS
jgi:hypothetical protein